MLLKVFQCFILLFVPIYENGGLPSHKEMFLILSQILRSRNAMFRLHAEYSQGDNLHVI
jgi:hypothetical protein